MFQKCLTRVLQYIWKQVDTVVKEFFWHPSTTEVVKIIIILNLFLPISY